MNRDEMDRLIDAHLEAKAAGDPEGCIAVYSRDVEHDVVGAPAGPRYGRDETRQFYEQLRRGVQTAELVPIRAYYGDDFCVIEHEWRGTVGGGWPAAFRILHIWEFRDGLISRENVWLDVWAVLRQLAHDATTPTTGSVRDEEETCSS
jgi:ketosteroid isomerase-like protein